MPRNNVVITGLGVVSSIGIGSDAFFAALLEKRSGIRSLAERTDDGPKPGACTEPAGTWIGGLILNFDPKQYVRPRKALKVMCREIQTAYAASQLAVEDAGLADALPADPEGTLKPQDVGTVFGSEIYYGPATEMQDAIVGCFREDGSIDGSVFGGVAMKNLMPLWMLKYLPNMPACHVGIGINAHGPNNSLVMGDVSGPAAMIEAASCIERGIAQVMLTGASGTLINTTRSNYRCDRPIPEVSSITAHSSRPHDPESKGVVGGEGAVTMVLESCEYAASRGAKPLARLVSSASRFVPSKAMSLPLRSNELSVSDQRGASDAIRLASEAALADADLSPDRIGLVVSHGAGDPGVDAAERQALKSVLPGVPVSAPIASLGHTGAASGAIGLAVGVLAMAHGTVPPTIRTETTSADAGFRDEPEKMQGDHVLCLSHTGEGNATAIIFGKVE
jgi:3-oxoacyl-[acyl-carrier-protein] synthase II